MDQYLDIRLLPDPEFQSTTLMSTLFSKLHRCLVRLRCDDIAVSFPESLAEGKGFGGLLRVHSSQAGFEKLQGDSWLQGIRAHVHIGEVSPIPAKVEHRQVRRVQSKSNPDRIRRRQMKRHGWTESEAREKIPDAAARMLNLPFVQLDSGSTGNQFKLFLDHRKAEEQVLGTFNAYGLSTEATVPWF